MRTLTFSSPSLDFPRLWELQHRARAVGGEEEGEEEDLGKGGIDASAILPYLVVVSGTRDRVK